MRVSRRMPVHGEFGGSGFKEQRYVRCADPWLSAFLFAVLERAAVSLRLRSGLQSLLQGQDSHIAKVLEIVGNCKVADDEKLVAWEVWGEGFVDLFRQKYSETDAALIIEYLQQTLAVQTLQWNEIEAEGYSHVYWGQTSDGTVVLLYRKPAMDSYIVLPECRHICEKYDLFRQAREALEATAASRNEFSQHSITCGVCSADVNQFVFDLAESAGPRNELVHQAILGDQVVSLLERDCAACRDGKSLCEHEACRCCLECAMISAISDSGSKCPNCQNRLILEKFKKEASERDGRWMNCENWITIECENCCMDKPIAEFSMENKEQVRWICNSCSSSLNQGEKLECDDDIQQRQLLESRQSPGFLETKANSMKRLCKGCNFERDISDFKAYLRESHRCLACDYCVRIFLGEMNEKKCVMCSESFSPNDINQFLRDASADQISEIYCDKCNQRKSIESYAQSSKLPEWWQQKVCDSCLRGCSYLSSKSHAYERSECQVEELKQIEKCIICELCLKEKPAEEFETGQSEHRCHICKPCYLVKVSRLQRCPLCKGIHKADSLNDKNHCQSCSHLFDSRAFLTSCKLEHPCVLCEDCIATCVEKRECIMCFSSYNDHDFGILQAIRPKQQLSTDICACGQSKVDGKLFCIHKCFCSFCLFKHIIVTGKRQCPKCHKTIEGISLCSVKCSDCMEAIAVNRSEPNKLTGVCENGCILCRRCVIIEGQRLVCPVCGAAVQGEDVQTILLEQKQCLLACRCTKPQGKLKPAKCGHDLHINCAYMTFSCRVCRQLLKPRPETINISQFA